MKKGGGQDARATVARASCPEPSITIERANRTVLGVPPASVRTRARSYFLKLTANEEVGEMVIVDLVRKPDLKALAKMQ